jgi:Skp family chaperone for outer membrane proteins
MAMSIKLSCGVTVALAALVGGLPGTDEDATRVAVVDLFRVLAEAKPFRAADEEIRGWIEAEKARLQAASDEIARKESELEMFEVGSQEHVKRRNELELMRLQFKQRLEERDAERTRRIVENQKRSYAQASAAIEGVARQRGATLVLQLRAGDPEGKDPAEMTSEVWLRPVLYSDAALDITADVLRILDH